MENKERDKIIEAFNLFTPPELNEEQKSRLQAIKTGNVANESCLLPRKGSKSRDCLFLLAKGMDIEYISIALDMKINSVKWCKSAYKKVISVIRESHDENKEES